MSDTDPTQPLVPTGSVAAPPPAQGMAPSSTQIGVLGGGLLLAGILLIATLVEVWPAATAAEEDAERDVALLFGLFSSPMSVDEALLLLIVVAGSLGAMVNTATEFAYRVGDGRLDRSYLWWYPMRFVIASMTALILYFVVRGGLFDPTPEASDDVNVYVFAALAALAGLFSTQAVRRLGRIFGALPGLEEPYAEAQPKVSGLVHGEDDPKGHDDELVVRGHGFARGSLVFVDGRPTPARLIDDTRLGLRLGAAAPAPGDPVHLAVLGPADDPDAPRGPGRATTVVLPERGRPR